MYSIIFCGGAGKRTWPWSLVNRPKYLLPVPGEKFAGKSSFRLTLDRIASFPSVGYQKVIVASSQDNLSKISTQAKEVPSNHYIGEPTIRDLGAAVGLAAFTLEKIYEKEGIDPNEPFVILWSDALLEDEKSLVAVLSVAEKEVLKNPKSMVFVGHKAYFANPNLGWIALGDKLSQEESISIHSLAGWLYRPKQEDADKFFARGDAWNLGNFITTPAYLISLYEKFAPKFVTAFRKIQAEWGTDKWVQTLSDIYPTLPEIHFDNLIIEPFAKSDLKESAKVLVVDLGWRDIGTWTALWEYLPKDENGNSILETPGKIVTQNCQNCLIVNADKEDTLLTVTGQQNKIIVRTEEAGITLDVGKDGDIKKLLDVLKEKGLGRFI